MSALAYEVVGYDPLINKAYQRTGLGTPLVDYLASKRNSGRAATTLRDKEDYIGAFALMFPRKTLSEITPFDVMHWEAGSGVGASSRRTRRSHLNDFFEWNSSTAIPSRNSSPSRFSAAVCTTSSPTRRRQPCAPSR